MQFVHVYSLIHGRIVRKLTVSLEEVNKLPLQIIRVQGHDVFVVDDAAVTNLYLADRVFEGECIPVIVNNGNFNYNEEVTIEEFESLQKDNAFIYNFEGTYIITVSTFERVRQLYGKR